MPITGTGTVLSTLIKTKMASNGITITDDAELTKLTKAIAEAVIEHLIANALITTTGITAGGASAPGTIS